jgi:hypothetical protein
MRGSQTLNTLPPVPSHAAQPRLARPKVAPLAAASVKHVVRRGGGRWRRAIERQADRMRDRAGLRGVHGERRSCRRRVVYFAWETTTQKGMGGVLNGSNALGTGLRGEVAGREERPTRAHAHVRVATHPRARRAQPAGRHEVHVALPRLAVGSRATQTPPSA